MSKHTFTIDATSAHLEAHGHKVALDSLPDASINYLIRLGFTTAINNCTAGMAAKLREEGANDTDIAKALAAERADKFAQICGGSLRVGGGGVRLDDQARYVRDKVLAVVKARLVAMKLPVPEKMTDLIAVSHHVLPVDTRQAIEQDARAAYQAEQEAIKQAANTVVNEDANSELAALLAKLTGKSTSAPAQAKAKVKKAA